MKYFLFSILFLSMSIIASAQCEQVTLDAEYQACASDSVILDSGADVTGTIQWFFNGVVITGEISPMLTVTQAGTYSITSMQQGATCTAVTEVIFATPPTITFNPVANGQSFCQGEDIAITATSGFFPDCDTSFDQLAALPDGNGESYEFCLTIDCFEENAQFESVSDLISFCINIEHSYLGDLDVILTSPSGAEVYLVEYPIAGGNIFLGIPIDDDTDPQGVGVGFDYCFSADGDVTLVNGEQENFSIVSGTYLPVQSFDAFIGSPLNGDWCLTITDNLASDNGYLFGFDYNFDPALYNNEPIETPNNIVASAWEDNPNILTVTGDTITVASNITGEFCYDYTVEDDFGCTYTETICITIQPGAIACEPEALVVCDDDNDGFSAFDLTVADSSILCGNPPGDLIVGYHETLLEADGDFNNLSSPYINIVPNQQIVYARLTNLGTGCFDVVELELLVLETPIANSAPDLVLEDIDGDGVEVFDLTVNEAIITDGNPDATVNYFETVADSQSNVNPISNPTSYLSPTRTVFIRVENAVSGCTNFTTFNIVVQPPAPVDSDNDGIPDAEEDLNSNNDLEDDDTDDDGIPNYLDPDDDGDNVPTAVEIEGIGAGFGPQDFIDTDDDTIENYLDNDDDGDGALTIEEDYNNNGSPLDDDTDNSGIPDFLEFNVNLSVKDFNFLNARLVPNPATNAVRVTWSQNTSVKTIHVYSIRGELIKLDNNVQNVSEATISLRELASGVYFIQLISEEGKISTQKLIKK